MKKHDISLLRFFQLRRTGKVELDDANIIVDFHD